MTVYLNNSFMANKEHCISISSHTISLYLSLKKGEEKEREVAYSERQEFGVRVS